MGNDSDEGMTGEASRGTPPTADDLSESAPALPALIAGLASEVRQMRTALERVFRRYRTVRVAASLAVVAALLSGWSTLDNRHSAHVACKRDNVLRQANLNLWLPILAKYPQPAPPGPDATDAERKRYEDSKEQRDTFTKNLGGFALHDC